MFYQDRQYSRADARRIWTSGPLHEIRGEQQFFKRDCLPRTYRWVSFATVRRDSLEHAVIIEERGEAEIHLIFNADYPLKRTANLMVRKALAA